MSPIVVALGFAAFALPVIAHAGPCPTIMLVLDQSASMSQDPCGGDPPVGPSKWALLQDVIISTIKAYGDRVPFGLELFSTMDWHDDFKCYDATSITVEPSTAAAGDVIAKIKAAQPTGDTNTGEAIRRAYSDVNFTANPQVPHYIILVTDGNPDCNSGDTETGMADYTISEIANAAAMGIRTYVIGFDCNGANPANLDSMAHAGETDVVQGCSSSKMPPVPCYYQPGASSTDFEQVFAKIVSQIEGEFSQVCDDSCYTLGCPQGQICTTDESNPDPHCENDPCAGKTCTGNTFCRNGGCVGSCADGCAAAQKCSDGSCVADPCAEVSCTLPQVCDPASGSCIDSPCANCTVGSICDVASRKCVANQCLIITCPSGLHCTNNGNCVKPAGCGCAVGAGGGGEGWKVLFLVAAVVLSKRRAKAAAGFKALASGQEGR